MSDSTQNNAAQSSQTSSQGGGASVPAKGGGVNGQILDAVKQSTAAVLGSATQQGAATSYQKVAQATAFAVQDATDYSRNVENIAMTAQGVIIAKMLADTSAIATLTPVLAIVQEMVIAASTNLATVGSTAATVASAYPTKTAG